MKNEKTKIKTCPGALKELFFSILLLFLPLIIFAQSNRAQTVALVPFWGDNEQFILEFGEELFKGVGGMPGYRPVVIDMTNLPDDVPEGGFPPYICPSPSLIKTNPIALTGELTPDPDDEEFWHLRLYLWEMSETRLVFSDEVTAYDREELAAGLPGMLDWLFSWLKKGGAGSGIADGDSTGTLGHGRQVFVTTSTPLQWMYIGLRGGGALRLQEEPDGFTTNPDYVGNFYDSVSAALSFSLAFFPESVPFFSRFGLQLEGIFNYDFNISNNPGEPVPAITISPAVLLKVHTYRQGNLLFSILGGAYTSFPVNDKIETFNAYQSFPVGWTVGLKFAGKIDPLPGLFFIDLRFSRDEWLFNTFVQPGNYEFRRNAVTVSAGYEIGIITKK